MLLSHFKHLRAFWPLLALSLAVATTLQLILCLPSGSVDVSDLWPFLGFIVVPVSLALGFRLLRGIRVFWLRIGGNIALSALLLLSSASFFSICFVEVACIRRATPVYSPDGKHIALLQFTLRTSRDSYGHVYLRRSWSPFTDHVYEGLGDWDSVHNTPLMPKIHWIDNFHLVIRYWDNRLPYAGRGGPAHCKSESTGIYISCENTATVEEWQTRTQCDQSSAAKGIRRKACS